MSEPRKCTGTNKAGEPCKAPPRDGKDTCISHATRAEQAEAGFGGAENGRKGGEATRVPKLTEVLTQRVEERADEIIDKLFEGLNATRAVVVGTGPKARVEVVEDRAEIRNTVREIYDRFEGRPRQVQEISGPDGGEIPLGAAIPVEDDWHAAVIRLGEQVTADANGNGNGAG